MPETIRYTPEYNKYPTEPTPLQFMYDFWQEAGLRIGKSYVVDDLLLTGKEIERKLENGYMYSFAPAGVSKEDLGKMFPEMRCWAVEEGNQVVDLVSNSGWFSTEVSINTPHLGITEKQLGKMLKEQERQGDSLRTYITRGQILKLLIGMYPDQGSTWSILPNSCYQGKILKARFRSDGHLQVNTLLNTYSLNNVGTRFVKWI